MQFYEISICQVMIFRRYAPHNKHEMIKIVNQTREKSQVLLGNARIILLPSVCYVHYAFSVMLFLFLYMLCVMFKMFLLSSTVISAQKLFTIYFFNDICQI